MGYRTNIAIDVDVLTRSIEINIRNKEKNTEKLIKNIQKNMVFIIENLIKISPDPPVSTDALASD